MIMTVGALGMEGFMTGEWGGEPQECADHKCGRMVSKGDACIIEMQSSTVYCEGCGKVKRYIVKKAREREALN